MRWLAFHQLKIGMAATTILAAGSVGGPARADDCASRGGSSHRVVEVLDGATLVLDDARIIRLAGVVPPLRPLDVGDEDAWPIEATARRALADLVVTKNVRVAATRNATDRHGRTLARVIREDDLWIGGAMIEAGFVRAGVDDGPCRRQLLRREEKARAAGRGLWALPAFQVGRAGDPDLTRRAGRYALVEGRVLSVGEGRKVVFLNFGENWRKDFTAMLYGTGGRAWKTAGFDPKKLAGQPVRIRGWLEANNGALIRVTKPAQIERLGDSPGGTRDIR